MPGDALFKVMNGIHRTLVTATGGRFGWAFSGMPVLELTTTGRRTGQPRKTMLTTPYQEGDTIVIVASRGGDDKNPAWYLNLREHPDVMVSLGGKPAQPMTAEVAGPEERARIWPALVAKHRNYAGYQKRTQREIPLILLHPAGV